MQLFVFEHNTWREIKSRPIGGMSGGEPIHSQHTRYESGAYDS